MSDEPAHGRGQDPQQPWSEQIRHSRIGALVPAHVARGVFCTGAVVLDGAHEFLLDFLLRMSKPQQVVARVVMVPAVLQRFIAALRQNVQLYEQSFGNQRLRPLEMPGQPTPSAPAAPVEQPVPAPAGHPAGEGGSPNEADAAAPAQNPGGTTVSDLYEQLKLPDEMLAGCYANAVMIGHTPSEFSFDFITTFFPRSVVSCRVFMSAGSVPVFLNSITHAYEQHVRKHNQPPPAL
jgi:hypothetical protein